MGRRGGRFDRMSNKFAPSNLPSSGLSLAIVGRLLGDTQAQTTHRYAHLADAPLRAATEMFGVKAKGLGGRQNAK